MKTLGGKKLSPIDLSMAVFRNHKQWTRKMYRTQMSTKSAVVLPDVMLIL